MFQTMFRRSATWLVGLLLVLTVAACSPASAATLAAPASAAAATGAATNIPAPGATSGALVAVAKFNLNTMTAADILTVPNAGTQMVREFQEYRPYASILEFRQAIGKYVDASQVAAYENYVYVPIGVNAADAATLQQIPGVDATLAAALMAGRPYANTDAFLARLGQSITASQLAIAKTYLAAQ